MTKPPTSPNVVAVAFVADAAPSDVRGSSLASTPPASRCVRVSSKVDGPAQQPGGDCIERRQDTPSRCRYMQGLAWRYETSVVVNPHVVIEDLAVGRADINQQSVAGVRQGEVKELRKSLDHGIARDLDDDRLVDSPVAKSIAPDGTVPPK